MYTYMCIFVYLHSSSELPRSCQGHGPKGAALSAARAASGALGAPGDFGQRPGERLGPGPKWRIFMIFLAEMQDLCGFMALK